MDGIRNPIDLIPVLREHGVTGDRLVAAALEAQKQHVLWVAVNNVGTSTSDYRGPARTLVRKAFKGLVLKDTWDVIADGLSDMGKWGRYQAPSAMAAPSYYYNSRQAPIEVLQAAGMVPAGVTASTCRCGDPTCREPERDMVWCVSCGQHEEAS